MFEVKGERDFIIYLSDFTGLVKDRFTIAHELGHYVMHSEMGKTPVAVARHVSSDRVEAEANWFAEGFLMPENIFRKEFKRNENTDSLAAFFMVSPQAIEARAGHLGID